MRPYNEMQECLNFIKLAQFKDGNQAEKFRQNSQILAKRCIEKKIHRLFESNANERTERAPAVRSQTVCTFGLKIMRKIGDQTNGKQCVRYKHTL